jgi:hypothetical protein
MASPSLFNSDALGVHCVFDPTRAYRYVWSYELGPFTRRLHNLDKRLMFCGLNPSKADEVVFDNTVKKWIAWGRDWGYGCLDVVNAFALRSTDPKALYVAVRDGQDPVGPENDRHILEVAARASLRVVGWGKHAKLLNRDTQMSRLLADFDLYCMDTNSDNSPTHPLYLKSSTTPVIWQARIGDIDQA